jgi:hypothetical protein
LISTNKPTPLNYPPLSFAGNNVSFQIKISHAQKRVVEILADYVSRLSQLCPNHSVR